MRQRTFTGIDQQHCAIHHVQAAFDLAAKIGMAGCINNIDLYAMIVHSGIFGGNRDAAFLFQRHRIHHAILHRLISAEDAGLFEHGVEQGGFTVVNVSNNGNVS